MPKLGSGGEIRTRTPLELSACQKCSVLASPAGYRSLQFQHLGIDDSDSSTGLEVSTIEQLALRKLVEALAPKETRIFLPQADDGAALCRKKFFGAVGCLPGVKTQRDLAEDRHVTSKHFLPRGCRGRRPSLYRTGPRRGYGAKAVHTSHVNR
jgi:hypothetical protein